MEALEDMGMLLARRRKRGNMQNIRILPEGDAALLVEFGNEIDPAVNSRVAAAARLLREQGVAGVTDVIPAYCSLLVNYDPGKILYDELKERLELLIGEMDISAGEGGRIVEIPVCYGGEFGPDLGRIAEHAGMSREEVVRLHSSVDYRIYMLGFLPGFCYLGGLAPELHTPRLPKPRLRIPAGSVGIGGAQTGIYPMDSPGGWQLMGRTPVKTYDPSADPPIPFEAGDSIRFVPVGREEYDRIRALVEKGEYRCRVYGG